MRVTDDLVSNRYQAISNHYADMTRSSTLLSRCPVKQPTSAVCTKSQQHCNTSHEIPSPWLLSLGWFWKSCLPWPLSEEKSPSSIGVVSSFANTRLSWDLLIGMARDIAKYIRLNNPPQTLPWRSWKRAVRRGKNRFDRVADGDRWSVYWQLNTPYVTKAQDKTCRNESWWRNPMKMFSVLLTFCAVKLPGRQLHHTEGR